MEKDFKKPIKSHHNNFDVGCQVNMKSVGIEFDAPFESWRKKIVLLYRQIHAFHTLVKSQHETKSVDLSTLIISEQPATEYELEALGMHPISLNYSNTEKEIENISLALSMVEMHARNLNLYMNDAWVTVVAEHCIIQ